MLQGVHCQQDTITLNITTILMYGCRHSEACTVKMSETSRLHPLAVYRMAKNKMYKTISYTLLNDGKNILLCCVHICIQLCTAKN